MPELLSEGLAVVPSIDSQTLGSNATVDGASADRRSGKVAYNDVVAVIDVGTWTDGTHTFTLEDSPDDSTWTAVAAGLFNGVCVVDGAADDEQQYKIDYLGSEQYVRVTVTSSGVTTGLAGAAAVIVLAGADQKPV